MKRRILLVLCTLVIIITLIPVEQANAAGSIPKGAKERNGNYYYVYEDDYLSWEAAKENCEALGGHLAVITSASEQAFIEKMTGSNFYWVGGTIISGKWKWVTGETWKYTNWSTYSPSSGNNFLLFDNYNLPRRWQSSDNDDDYAYICEWEAEDAETRLPIKVVISSVKKASSTAVNVIWTQIDDAEGYSVYMKVGVEGTYEMITDINEADITTFMKDKLTKGIKYYFRVRAYKTIYGEKSYGELSISKNITLK